MLLAQAQTESSAPMPGGGGVGFIVPLTFIFIILYFVVYRSRGKQRQKIAGTSKRAVNVRF